MKTDDPDAPPPRHLGVANTAAALVVTLGGILPAASARLVLSPVERATMIVCGLAYGLLATAGLAILERHGKRRHLTPYFAALLAFGCGADLAARGNAALLVLAGISQGVLYLERAGRVIIVGLFALCAMTTLAWAAPTRADFGQAAVSFSAAIAFVVAFSWSVRRQREQRLEVERLAGELGDANDKLRAYAAQIDELATTEERNRIAREIHDGLGHYLTVVHVQLEAAETLMERSPERARAAVEKARELVHEGLGDVRRSVAVLRGATPIGDLAPAIEKLVGACSAAGIEAKLDVAGEPRKLEPRTELTVYRAAQEALTNVRKHAKASRVDVALDFRDEARVVLRVSDDGVGGAMNGAGFGLVGVRERAANVGGSVRVDTPESGGFTLELEVPG